MSASFINGRDHVCAYRKAAANAGHQTPNQTPRTAAPMDETADDDVATAPNNVATGNDDVATADDNVATAPDNILHDPAWRLTAWALLAGATATALLTAVQTLAGALDGATGYPAAIVLLMLCAALLRDVQRRTRAARWVRDEVHEFFLPLGVLLVTLVLLARGAAITTCAPALLALLPVVWAFAHAPAAARVKRLFPYALPVIDEAAPPLPDDTEADADAEIEQIVRDVLDGLPPDITARLAGWSIEVQEEMPTRPRDEIVFGCCFQSAHAIAIYRRPHLRYHGRGAMLRRAVTYTVLHEIAHALGLDEIGVRRLGWLTDTDTP